MDDLTVKVVYLNKNMEQVNEKTYSLKDYVKSLKLELMRIIMDVEDLVYKTTKESKDNWNADVMSSFNRIRHKVLDQANAIERLPQNLLYKGNPFPVSFGGFLNSLNINDDTLSSADNK